MLEQMSLFEYQYEPVKVTMLLFEIHSTPKPQIQTRFRRTPIGIRVFDPSKLTKQQIIWQISPHAPKEPLRGSIAMDMTFYMPIPVHTTKTERVQMINGTIRPAKRPDFDNLAYIVTNSFKGIVYRDDAQVVDCGIHKYYSETPRTVVKVWEI
jgi:Holliday junction resolvase RusA-like endonuclease